MMRCCGVRCSIVRCSNRAMEHRAMWRYVMPRVSPIMGTIVGAFLAAALPARADDVAEFYKGKVITLTVSAGAGGGYDTLARTLARFLGRHVPGEPIAIVRNMAGGGGLAAANFIYAGAEKDG